MNSKDTCKVFSADGGHTVDLLELQACVRNEDKVLEAVVRALIEERGLTCVLYALANAAEYFEDKAIMDAKGDALDRGD